MRVKRRVSKGMTLVEVIISVALIAILLIPISSMIYTNVQTTRKVERQQEATEYAQQLLEELSTYVELKYNVKQETNAGVTKDVGEISLLDGTNIYFPLDNKFGTDDDYIYNGKLSKGKKSSNFDIEYSITKSDKITQDEYFDASEDTEKYFNVLNLKKDDDGQRVLYYYKKEKDPSDPSKYVNNLYKIILNKQIVKVNLHVKDNKDIIIELYETGDVLYRTETISSINDKNQLKIIESEGFDINNLLINLTSAYRTADKSSIELRVSTQQKSKIKVDLPHKYTNDDGSTTQSVVPTISWTNSILDQKKLENKKVGDLYYITVKVKDTTKKSGDQIIFSGSTYTNIVLDSV